MPKKLLYWLLILLLVCGCDSVTEPKLKKNNSKVNEFNNGNSIMKINVILDKHHDEIMAIPGVVGVGIGNKNGSSAIVIMVKELTPVLKTKLPQSLDGVPVAIEQTGEISAF